MLILTEEQILLSSRKGFSPEGMSDGFARFPWRFHFGYNLEVPDYSKLIIRINAGYFITDIDFAAYLQS